MAHTQDFDEIAFAASLKKLRRTWLEPCAPRQPDNLYLGEISRSGKGADPSQVHIIHPQALPATSNHERLLTEVWQRRVKAEFLEFLRILQTVPAFDTPRFSVKIRFNAGDPTRSKKLPLPRFQLSLQHCWMTTTFAIDSKQVVERLRAIRRDIAALPRPLSPSDYSIDSVIWQADTPEHAVRLYAAIAHPSLIGDRTPLPGAMLPSVTQIHDQERLMSSLRQT